MIRIEEAWLGVDPLDMRAGFDTVLARVVAVFDADHPHHADLQPSGQPHEGARARRNRNLAGSTTAEPGTVRLAAAWNEHASGNLARATGWTRARSAVAAHWPRRRDSRGVSRPAALGACVDTPVARALAHYWS
jgi:hypothetical protein